MTKISKQKILPFSEVILEKLPLLTVASVASFGFISLLLLILGMFETGLIWIFGLFAVVVSWWVVFKYSGREEKDHGKNETIIIDIIVIAGLVLWGFYNAAYASQHVFTNRDPATYALVSARLSDKNNAIYEIDKSYAGVIKGITSESAGFALSLPDNDEIHSQGTHIFPAILGAIGKFVGNVHVLRLNAFIGMLALFAVYSVAKKFTRPYWAATATAALALSMPMLYFSRDTYTEPLMALFVFGGVHLLYASHSAKGSSYPLWALTGFVFGASALARVDGYFILVIPAMYAVLSIIFAKYSGKISKQTYIKAGILVAAALTVGFVGLLDISQLSSAYYNDIRSHIFLELLAVFAVLIGGLVLSLINWHKGYGKGAVFLLKNYGPKLAVFALLLFFASLASRPLWDEAISVRKRHNELGDLVPTGEVVRTYAEYAVYWPLVYLGPIIGLSGIFGMIALWMKNLIKPHPVTIALLAGVGVTMLLYLVQPSIAADQIWASRRQLPVIMPGFIIFAAAGIGLLYNKYLTGLSAVSRAVAIVFITHAILLAPLIVSRPLIASRDTARLGAVQATCNVLPDNAVVLLAGVSRRELMQPLKTYCGVSALGINKGKVFSQEDYVNFARIAEEKGLIPFIAAYGGEIDLVSKFKPLDSEKKNYATIDIGFNELEQTFRRPPSKMIQQQEIMVISRVTEEGRLVVPEQANQ